MRVLAAALLSLVVAVPSVMAEVKIARNAKGELVLSNDPPRRTSARRTSSRAVRRMMPSAALEGLIQQYAAHNRLDADLVRAVMQVESAFDPRARSVKGAMGLMQLMPETARELGVGNPWNPEENVRGGTRYLRMMLDRFDERTDLALAGYNAGPSAVERYGGVPPYRETLNYVDKVLRIVDGRGWSGTPGRLRNGNRPRRPRSNTILVRRDASNQLVLVTP